MHLKVLILDVDALLCDKINTLLRNNGYVTRGTHDFMEAKQLLKAASFDLLIAGCHPKQTDATGLLDDLRKYNSNIKVIFTGTENDMPLSIELMHRGAFYFLTKPLNPEILLEKVKLALCSSHQPATQTIREENKRAARLPYSYISGNSAISRQLSQEIELVAPTDYSVIIQGETGTGKESVARLLHKHSTRADKPFIAIDCGSLTRELAASELFGHEKGAFTGAVNDKTGAFQLADGGTLFLDEIGNLPYEVQTCLLRSIQERVIRKVGSNKEIRVDVRLLVATNERLEAAVRGKKFREDLYHRINEFKIMVPPLRERMADLPIFIDSFIKEAAERLDKAIPGISQSTMERLTDYFWPGNIRELKNVIKNACLRTAPGQIITKAVFPEEFLQSDCKEILQQSERPLVIASGEIGIKDAAKTAKAFAIFEVLERVRHNKSKAAEMLKIDRKTLYNKLKRLADVFDIHRKPFQIS